MKNIIPLLWIFSNDLSNLKMSTARTWSSKISCRRRKGNQKTLVQLVGGADPSFDQEERSQQNNSDLVSSSKPPSEPSPQTSHIKEPFITKVLNQKGKFLSTKETEERIPNNLKHAMMFLQKITSQSAPALLAVSSLLGSGQNDVSYKTLYALSLLGASCGFHLFLHFITLGYALGVTFPVCASFYFYSVRLHNYHGVCVRERVCVSLYINLLQPNLYCFLVLNVALFPETLRVAFTNDSSLIDNYSLGSALIQLSRDS